MGGFPQAETETIVLQREGGSSFVGGAVMGDGDDHSPVFLLSPLRLGYISVLQTWPHSFDESPSLTKDPF